MVDDSRLAPRHYKRSSEESSENEDYGVKYQNSGDLLSKKANSIADYNPQTRRIRKDPFLSRQSQQNDYHNQDDDDSSIDLNNEEGIEFPVRKKPKFKSSSSDQKSDSSDSFQEYRAKRRPPRKSKNSRASVRAKRQTVNYKEEDNNSDDFHSDDVPSNDHVKKKKSKFDIRENGHSRNKNVSDESEEDDDSLMSDKKVEVFVNPEDQDIIEEVLLHQVRRIGATGNSSTMYNVHLEKDPNEKFDAKTEKGELQYLIKWKNWSHIHSTWETEASLNSSDRVNPVVGLKKLQIYKDNMRQKERIKRHANPDQLEAIICDEEQHKSNLNKKMEVERIVSHSRDKESNCYDYLVKWHQLEYRHCTWESGKVVEALYPNAVQDYETRCNSQTLPNLKNPVLRMRPKFQRLVEQPSYIGACHKKGSERLELHAYQLKGLNWLAHAWCRGNSVILADEMGLGKTIQTISLLSYLFHAHDLYGPFLLVVPLSTISNWCHECSLWAEEMNTIAYIGDNVSRQLIREHEWSALSKKNQSLKFNICITTYEILLKDKNWLCNVPWAVLAVDEAHRLKNDQSQLYKALFTFNTNSRVLITGTPLQNSLKELWALLHFIMPNEFHEWEEFEENYSITESSGENQQDALQKLHKILEPYLLRRVKRDVEYSLPAKTEHVLRVGMSSRQADMYRLILARNYDGLMRVTNGHKTSFVNIMMELKKCCNHSFLIAPPEDDDSTREAHERLTVLVRGSGKLMLLDKLLQRLKQNGHRVLIFSQMVRMLDIIAEYLMLRRWGFQRLDGSISGEERKQALIHFNAENSNDFCFLLSTRAGGLGINLATADTVIIFDSDWNPQNDIQAMARAHRIGQKKQVSVYRLVTKESIEEKIIESATRKMVLDHLVIQKMESSGGSKQSKPDSRGKLYSDILKYGAEGLFAKTEGEGEPDVDIDNILNQAETRDVEEQAPSNHPASALLSTFSIVNIDTMDESEPVIMSQSSKGAAPVKNWDEIIPDELINKVKEEQQETDLITLELGPRVRKKVTTYQAGLGSDSDSNESENSKNRKLISNNDKEIRAVLKSMRKFSNPLARVSSIIADAEIGHRSEKEVSNLIDTIISGCRETLAQFTDKKDVKNATFTVSKVSIPAKQIIQSIDDLSSVEEELFGNKKKLDRLKVTLPFLPKTVNWNCSWTDFDDVSLLVGVFEHGYDNWESIKLDSDLGLGSKLLPLNGSDRPQSSHIRTRVEYLMKSVKKHQEAPSKMESVVSKKSTSKSSSRSGKRAKNENCDNTIKSSEFVDSDNVSSQNSYNVKETKTAKKSSKSASSSKKKPIGPMHFTSRGEPVTISDEADKHFSGMKGVLFETCKKLMHPIRKLFRRLQKIEDADEDQQPDYISVILEIGQHIRQIVKKFSANGIETLINSANSNSDEDISEKDVDYLSCILTKSDDIKNYLWKFVQFFSNKTGPELEALYSSRRKSSHHSSHNHSHESSVSHHRSHNNSEDHSKTHCNDENRLNSHSRRTSSPPHNPFSATSSSMMNGSENNNSRFDNAFNRLPTTSTGHESVKPSKDTYHHSHHSANGSSHRKSSSSKSSTWNRSSNASNTSIDMTNESYKSKYHNDKPKRNSYQPPQQSQSTTFTSRKHGHSTPQQTFPPDSGTFLAPPHANTSNSRDPRLQNHNY